MKYLLPKKISLSDLEILESKHIFKIKNINNPIHLFGIPIQLEDVTITKDNLVSRYFIILSDKDYQNIQIFNSFLSESIENCKSIIQDNIYKQNILIIYPNKVIESYHAQHLTSFYINIKYVKKSGFFNYPVLNIL